MGFEMKKYFISVDCRQIQVPQSLWILAEKGELGLSRGKHLCSIFYKGLALFDTEEEAKKFLRKCRIKLFWNYRVMSVE